MSRLLVHRDPRFAECTEALAGIPAIQSHVTAVMAASKAIGIPFVSVPASLEGAGKSLARLIPNNESGIMAFDADVESDITEAMAAIRLELLTQGTPTLTVGDRSIPVDPAKVIDLGLISVDENQVRALVVGRRALDSFIRNYPELIDFITVDDAGHVIVDKAVHEFMDDRYCRYANSRQLAAWKDLQAVVGKLEALRGTYGLTLEQISRNVTDAPDGTLAIDPAILSLTDQIRQPAKSV